MEMKNKITPSRDEWVREMWMNRGYTQQEIGNVIHVTRQRIEQIVRGMGKRKQISLEELQVLVSMKRLLHLPLSRTDVYYIRDRRNRRRVDIKAGMRVYANVLAKTSRTLEELSNLIKRLQNGSEKEREAV